MSNVSKSYKVYEESETNRWDCFRLDVYPKEQCWGEVTIIDYVNDEYPIFACCGHAAAADGYLDETSYIKEPSDSTE